MVLTLQVGAYGSGQAVPLKVAPVIEVSKRMNVVEVAMAMRRSFAAVKTGVTASVMVSSDIAVEASPTVKIWLASAAKVAPPLVNTQQELPPRSLLVPPVETSSSRAHALES